jgi:polysaccharide biosynthesis/export protein
MITQLRNLPKVAATSLLMALLTNSAISADKVQVALAPATGISDDYIIGPGDNLEVYVSQLPELSRVVAVRPDGKISTPEVEDLVADGKSPTQLAREIEAVLTKIVRTPKVTVIVTNAVSASSQVKVLGQVREQKAIPYREGLRVSDLILAAGGLSEYAAPNRSHISRDADGKEVKIAVKLGDLLNKSKRSQDFELKPGDVLFVPQSRW